MSVRGVQLLPEADRAEERGGEQAAAPAPVAPLPAMVLQLQRTAGNQAVARMLLQRQADADAADEGGAAIYEGEEDAERASAEDEEEPAPLGPEDELEGPVVAGEGQIPSADGDDAKKRTFEPPGPPEPNLLARSVNVPDIAPGHSGAWRALSRGERESFARTRFPRGRRRNLAFRIMADMASASAELRFGTLDELYEEVQKRLSNSLLMQESQQHLMRGQSRVQAFGYPFSGAALLYGPRVNYSAREYWTPRPPDDYAPRRDRARARRVRALPRGLRHEVYGDMSPGSYRWSLTDAGKADPYSAIMKMFIPQPPHRQSLIHCDYLISLVHVRTFAARVGQLEFNRRVARYGPDRIQLRFDLFTDLQTDPAFAGTAPLGSLQTFVPADEGDLLMGDHVYFFNHAAYDPLNAAIGNAWRLENALLIDRLGGSNDDRNTGTDIFLGHGSGRKTSAQMKAKLAEEYNDVVDMARPLVARIDRGDAAAEEERKTRFPNVKKAGAVWRVQGTGLAGPVDVELRRIRGDEVIGPRDPNDPGRMYPVRRPVESA